MQSFIRKILLCFLLLSFPIYPDTIILKNGTEIPNAKAIIKKTSVLVIQSNGNRRNIPKNQIKKVVPQEEVWFKKKKHKPKISKKDLEEENKELRKENAKLQKENEKLRKENEELEKKLKATTAKKKNRDSIQWDNVWRSGVFPGWGQYRNGNNIRAGVYASLFLGFLYMSYSATKEYTKAKDEQNQTMSAYWLTTYSNQTLNSDESVESGTTTGIIPGIYLNENFNNNVNNKKNLAKKMYVATFLVWLTSVVDATLSKKPQSQKKASWNFDLFYAPITGSFNHYEAKINVHYQWQF